MIRRLFKPLVKQSGSDIIKSIEKDIFPVILCGKCLFYISAVYVE